MAKPLDDYRGWKVWHTPGKVATAQYSAERYGVAMQAMSLESLKNMIDQRIRDYPSSGGA